MRIRSSLSLSQSRVSFQYIRSHTYASTKWNYRVRAAWVCVVLSSRWIWSLLTHKTRHHERMKNTYKLTNWLLCFFENISFYFSSSFCWTHEMYSAMDTFGTERRARWIFHVSSAVDVGLSNERIRKTQIFRFRMQDLGSQLTQPIIQWFMTFGFYVCRDRWKRSWKWCAARAPIVECTCGVASHQGSFKVIKIAYTDGKFSTYAWFLHRNDNIIAFHRVFAQCAWIVCVSVECVCMSVRSRDG